ncbi:hypothetical protein ACN2CX_07860 [Aliarcobacter butzleri]|uniref:hypothetical protein n=1 Tax=Aliarcobacter butzleri TaxID=28197 RepID=UPI003AFB25FE
MSGDNVYGNKYEGDNVHGNKSETFITYEINHIDLDIGILTNILQTNPTIIKESLSKLNTSPSISSPDERTIPIDEKNLKNGLKEFYDNFIKRNEQKLAALDDFFQEEDYVDEIEEASDSIRLFIFTYANRNSNVLEPMIFNMIIQEHIKNIDEYNEKNIMKLVIYYLYRYCYIGAKDV